MKKRRFIPGPLLMIISITGILLFQLYWLKQNYEREEKAAKVKAELLFRESVMKLQVARLRLDIPGKDTGDKQVRIVFGNDEDRPQVEDLQVNGMVSTINVIRQKVSDSMPPHIPGKKRSMMITMSGDAEAIPGNIEMESTGPMWRPGRKGDRMLNLLYSVDSLQDSLRVKEIDSVFSVAIKKAELDIPFSISRTTKTANAEKNKFSVVTLGVQHPVSYIMQTGNLFPYLMRRIWQAVLFSIVLLAITIAAFLLLYKSLLRQRKLADMKNEFISNITHELKTPIATVGVAIEAMKNFNAMDDPQRTREYLDISQHELNRLSLLVDKVLKLSMFEKQGIELKPEELNLRGLVTEVIESLKLQLDKQRVNVETVFEGDTGLRGDKMHLQSVVFNLIDNAIKYGKNDTGTAVKLSLQGTEEQVILVVSDNGQGIPHEYHDKIFDKFFRVPHGETHNAKGYGLGLNYVAQVVKQHKGTIAVESTPGTGTTFTITLPKHIV